MSLTCDGVGEMQVGVGPVGDEVCTPAPGPEVGLPLILTRGPKVLTTERGIRWANAPGGRADLVDHGGERVKHVSSVQNVFSLPANINRLGTYSGAIKFRFRSYKSFAIPEKLNIS